MKFFSNDYIEFFKELEENNNTLWFSNNKKRYENFVKTPFYIFTETIIKKMSEFEKELNVSPKDCIFRINRDIRFSEDKSPYKLQCSAAISKGGKKDYVNPGFYFEINANKINFYGGVWQPDKNNLLKIRNYIADHTEDFKSAYSFKKFVELFKEIKGDKNKILSKDLKLAAEIEPLIYNKTFYYHAELDSKYILDDNLEDLFMQYYYAGIPIKTFFEEALNN